MRFADPAETIITLSNKHLNLFGRETYFESTRPIPHHVETVTISLSSRPRPSSRPKPQKIGHETYITGIITTIRMQTVPRDLYLHNVLILASVNVECLSPYKVHIIFNLCKRISVGNSLALFSAVWVGVDFF